MLTQLKNHAFSELHQEELIKLHHAAKFGVKRLKLKLIMNFYNMPNQIIRLCMRKKGDFSKIRKKFSLRSICTGFAAKLEKVFFQIHCVLLTMHLDLAVIDSCQSSRFSMTNLHLPTPPCRK